MTAEKPRLVVTTDIGGDPDDQQSLVRLMTYANEVDIEGLRRWQAKQHDDRVVDQSLGSGHGDVRQPAEM